MPGGLPGVATPSGTIEQAVGRSQKAQAQTPEVEGKDAKGLPGLPIGATNSDPANPTRREALA